jgi:hypothetical protein
MCCLPLVSEVSIMLRFILHWLIYFLLSRCDALPENLDSPGSHRRSHAKTDFLIKQWDPGILWDQFGIRSDIVVYLYFAPFM